MSARCGKRRNRALPTRTAARLTSSTACRRISIREPAGIRARATRCGPCPDSSGVGRPGRLIGRNTAPWMMPLNASQSLSVRTGQNSGSLPYAITFTWPRCSWSVLERSTNASRSASRRCRRCCRLARHSRSPRRQARDFRAAWRPRWSVRAALAPSGDSPGGLGEGRGWGRSLAPSSSLRKAGFTKARPPSG